MTNSLSEAVRGASADEADDRRGLSIESLEPGTTLAVQTARSLYRVVVLDGPRQMALIRGGTAFPEDTLIRIEGATGSRDGVKPGWIVVGLHVEFRLGQLRIKSSKVCSVSIVHVASPLEASRTGPNQR